MIESFLALLSDNFSFLLRGFLVTLELTFWSFVGGMLLATPLAIARSSEKAILRYPAMIVIDVLRGTPALMLVFWFYFMLPRFFGPLPAFTSGLIALIAFNASYSAEIIRAGIQSVGKGLVEAGRSSGLSETSILRHIVLPQAFSNMAPALVNQTVMLYKTTSIVFVIGVVDLFRAATIINNREFKPFETFILVGLIYFIPSTIVSRLNRKFEDSRRELRGQN